MSNAKRGIAFLLPTLVDPRGIKPCAPLFVKIAPARTDRNMSRSQLTNESEPVSLHVKGLADG